MKGFNKWHVAAIAAIGYFTWMISLTVFKQGVLPATPAEATPLEILQYIDVHEDEGRTWFSVHPGPDASEEYHVLIRPFFIVDLEGATKPFRLLRSPEVTVRIHPEAVMASEPVPYRKKDLWKIRADVLLDKGWHYEFVQPGWESFDPAKDLN